MLRWGGRGGGEWGLGRASEGMGGRDGGVLVAGGEEKEGTGEVEKGFVGEEEGRARLKETVRGVAEKGPGSGGRRRGGWLAGAKWWVARGSGGEEAGSVDGVLAKYSWGLEGSPSSESSSLGVGAAAAGDASEATKE